MPSKFYSILAAARPTIALVAPDCEVARCIDEYDCGQTVKQHDSKGLADAIGDFRAHADELSEMGRQARLAYEAKYSSADSAGEIYSLLVAASRTSSVASEQESFVLR